MIGITFVKCVLSSEERRKMGSCTVDGQTDGDTTLFVLWSLGFYHPILNVRITDCSFSYFSLVSKFCIQERKF